MEHILEISNLYKHFGKGRKKNAEALKDITLTVRSGEFFVLLGPSGSGKSTLLRIACGLDTASSGTVKYPHLLEKDDMSFVFQQFALLPWLTVGENVELGLIGRNIPEQTRDMLVKRELEEFGLSKFRHSHTRNLSGGMKQRVGLARAFVTEPKLMFLDEPFSELDFFTAEDLRKELLRLSRERGMTVIMVSHNIQEAVALADRIGVLTSRPGQLKEVIENTLPYPRIPRSPEFFAMEDRLSELLKIPDESNQ